MGRGVGVVASDGVVVVVVEVYRGEGRRCSWWSLETISVRAEFERTMKMECENESENDHFCKSEGRVRFVKNDHFSVHFHVILNSIFEK